MLELVKRLLDMRKPVIDKKRGIGSASTVLIPCTDAYYSIYAYNVPAKFPPPPSVLHR